MAFRCKRLCIYQADSCGWSILKCVIKYFLRFKLYIFFHKIVPTGIGIMYLPCNYSTWLYISILYFMKGFCQFIYYVLFYFLAQVYTWYTSISYWVKSFLFNVCKSCNGTYFIYFNFLKLIYSRNIMLVGTTNQMNIVQLQP